MTAPRDPHHDPSMTPQGQQPYDKWDTDAPYGQEQFPSDVPERSGEFERVHARTGHGDEKVEAAAVDSPPPPPRPSDKEDDPGRRVFRAMWRFVGYLMDLPDFEHGTDQQRANAFDCWWRKHGHSVSPIEPHEARADFLDAWHRRMSGKTFDFRRAMREADGYANSDLLPDVKRSPMVRRVGLVIRQMCKMVKAIPGRDPAVFMTHRKAAEIMGRYLPANEKGVRLLDHKAGQRALMGLMDARVIELAKKGEPRAKNKKGKAAQYRYIADDVQAPPPNDSTPNRQSASEEDIPF
jgi:hypothetical protein